MPWIPQTREQVIHLNADTALPTCQFFSGLILASIETWTMGMSRYSFPNMILKGIKTPWSSPGPRVGPKSTVSCDDKIDTSSSRQ